MITPTIGRKVWFRAPESLAAPAFAVLDREQAMDATVIFVHNDRMVNLSVKDHQGQIHTMQSVLLLQGDESYKPVGCYCEWMPYQLAQAGVAPAPTVAQTALVASTPTA